MKFLIYILKYSKNAANFLKVYFNSYCVSNPFYNLWNSSNFSCFISYIYLQNELQKHSNSFVAINHSGHRRLVSCFIMNSLTPLMVKIASTIHDQMENDMRIVNIWFIFINALSFSLTAIACYQFVFFCYCVKIRFKVFVDLYSKHFNVVKKFDENRDDDTAGRFFCNCIPWLI